MSHQDAKVYQAGNPWQKKVYLHMSNYLERIGITKFGITRGGNAYKHWLSEENYHRNFVTPEIHAATVKRFQEGKAGDISRALTNTAASQPYCFNLIIYLQNRDTLANKLFSRLLGKEVKVVHLQPEFTPNTCKDLPAFGLNGDESIGDQSVIGGTDSDIAVFYTYGVGQKGILLIEFKFIEAEFSVCTSYARKKELKAICDSKVFYEELIEGKKKDQSDRFLCGYNNYYNWDLTSTSKLFNTEAVKTASGCPFRFGLNQLWRNLLLAENVAQSRRCNEFGFWVLSAKENDAYLWQNGRTEQALRSVLNGQGNDAFRKIYLNDLFKILETEVENDSDRTWLADMEVKYKIAP
jgi:hypothetical protein